MKRTAEFSKCGQYRYLLCREWNETLHHVLIIMLNPSTANGTTDDPTIQRLIKEIQWQGYGGFCVVNLYALISSKPDKLFEIADPIGDNDFWVTIGAMSTHVQIFAWGDFKGIDYRARKMISLFPDALCFGKSKSGSPWHPMRMQRSGMRVEDTKLTRYR